MKTSTVVVLGIGGGVALAYLGGRAAVEKVVAVAKEAKAVISTAPAAVANPETYGMRDDSTTVGTRGWAYKVWDDWTGDQTHPADKVPFTAEEMAEIDRLAEL